MVFVTFCKLFIISIIFVKGDKGDRFYGVFYLLPFFISQAFI